MSVLISFVTAKRTNTDELSGSLPHERGKQVEKNFWSSFFNTRCARVVFSFLTRFFLATKYKMILEIRESF